MSNFKEPRKFYDNRLYSPESRARRWFESVNVEFNGLDRFQYTKQQCIDYIKAQTDHLDLNVKFNFDKDISKTGGIRLTFNRSGKVSNPFETRESMFYLPTKIGTYDAMIPKTIMECRINLDMIEVYPDDMNRFHAFFNVVLHEFIHALFIPEHTVEHPKVPKSCMNVKVSTADLYWTANDEQLILQKYGRVGEEFAFKAKDVGKNFLINYRAKKKDTHNMVRHITSENVKLIGLPKGKKHISVL